MPRPIADKCRLCAKGSVEEAQKRPCWVGQLCHQRRSNYKNRDRYNSERKRKRHALKALKKLEKLGSIQETPNLERTPADLDTPPALPSPPLPPAPSPAPPPTAPEPVTTLSLPPPGTAAAYIHFYRERKDAPLHALAAELWLGGKKIAVLPPLHTLGATESDIRAVLLQVLAQFSQRAGKGKRLSQFRGSIELHPHHCPLRPCPLHPEPVTPDDVHQISL
jgi:hypothetical protein